MNDQPNRHTSHDDDTLPRPAFVAPRLTKHTDLSDGTADVTLDGMGVAS